MLLSGLIAGCWLAAVVHSVGIGNVWSRAQNWNVSIELVVRSFAKELPELLLFLRSVELYWPWDHVLAVMDDTEADRLAASTLPRWCRVVYEPVPPYWQHYAEVRYGAGKPLSKGYVRAQWSMFQLDRYTSCEYIAFFDSDVVLLTFITPRILFSPNGRPVVKGNRYGAIFYGAIAMLGWQYVAEFMQDFPLVLHKSTFAVARRAVTEAAVASGGSSNRCKKFGLCGWWSHQLEHLGPRRNWGFDEAFLWLNKILVTYSYRGIKDAQVLPCGQSILSHVAWHLQYHMYAWSIYDDGPPEAWQFAKPAFDAIQSSHPLPSLPQEARCPSLSAAFHLGHYDSEWIGRGSAQYFDVGHGLMLWGLCNSDVDYSTLWTGGGGTATREAVTRGLCAGEDLRGFDLETCAAECWMRPYCNSFFLSRAAQPSCLVVNGGCSKTSDASWDYFQLRSRRVDKPDVAEAFDVSKLPNPKCWQHACTQPDPNGDYWGCMPGVGLNEHLATLNDAFRLSWADAKTVPKNCTQVSELLAAYRRERVAILDSLGPAARDALIESAISAPKGPAYRASRPDKPPWAAPRGAAGLAAEAGVEAGLKSADRGGDRVLE